MANFVPICALILAAGKGTRMQSPLPKVLHQIGAHPMLVWVMRALETAGIQQYIVVVGGELDPFLRILSKFPRVLVCEQRQRRGTGDAVAAAWKALAGVVKPDYADGELLRGEPIKSDYILVCNGDTPNLNGRTIQDFCHEMMTQQADLAVIGMKHPRPLGYGRIIKDKAGNLQEIIEEKDADEATRQIDLCNTGVVLCRTPLLFDLLAQITTHNAQKEYYLTDCFALAHKHGKSVKVYETDDWQGFEGVNDPEQLMALSKLMLAAP